MDKDSRRPDHPDYDCTTLHIPKECWTGKDPHTAKFTPAMGQYWTLKIDNFEKIFLFKLGKFYELFFKDAIICQQLLDLNWMGGAKKLHVGFPEKALDKYLEILVNAGFKVAVIEQTETPKQLEERQKGMTGPKQKCVNREICNMVTKGTYKAAEQGYQPKYCLAIKKHGNEFGVTFFDVTTLEFHIGQFVDDENMSSLRTLICQIRPVEVIFEREMQGSDFIKMLKNSPTVPVFTALPTPKCYSFVKTSSRLQKYFGESALPAILKKLQDSDQEFAFNALGMSIAFLEDALIVEQTIKPAIYHEFTPESSVRNEYMVLDAQAL